jgi:hypothetical protein
MHDRSFRAPPRRHRDLDGTTLGKEEKPSVDAAQVADQMEYLEQEINTVRRELRAALQAQDAQKGKPKSGPWAAIASALKRLRPLAVVAAFGAAGALETPKNAVMAGVAGGVAAQALAIAAEKRANAQGGEEDAAGPFEDAVRLSVRRAEHLEGEVTRMKKGFSAGLPATARGDAPDPRVPALRLPDTARDATAAASSP